MKARIVVEGAGCDGEEACDAFSVTTSIFCPFTPDAHMWLRLSPYYISTTFFVSPQNTVVSRSWGVPVQKPGSHFREKQEERIGDNTPQSAGSRRPCRQPDHAPPTGRPAQGVWAAPSFLPPGGLGLLIRTASPSGANHSPIDFSFFPPSLCLSNDVHQG